MALEYKDSVADTSTTTGTGTFTLLGVAPPGRRTVAAAHTTGATVRYRIESADLTQWEVGEGVWTSSGATLTRATVYASSNTGSLVNFSAGTKTVITTPTAADMQRQHVFSAYLNTATNSTSAGWQKVPVDTVEVDTGGFWDSTNKRYLPLIAGWYAVVCRTRFTTAGDTAAGVGKNGSIFRAVGADATSAAAGGGVYVYCNGTTDYIENWVSSSSVRAMNIGDFNTYFQVVGPVPTP